MIASTDFKVVYMCSHNCPPRLDILSGCLREVRLNLADADLPLGKILRAILLSLYFRLRQKFIVMWNALKKMNETDWSHAEKQVSSSLRLIASHTGEWLVEYVWARYLRVCVYLNINCTLSVISCVIGPNQKQICSFNTTHTGIPSTEYEIVRYDIQLNNYLVNYFIVFSCNCLYHICLINKLFNFNNFISGFCNLLWKSKTRKHLIWLLQVNCALTSYNKVQDTRKKKTKTTHHSTKNSENFETGTNGRELSWESS